MRHPAAKLFPGGSVPGVEVDYTDKLIEIESFEIDITVHGRKVLPVGDSGVEDIFGKLLDDIDAQIPLYRIKGLH